MAHALCYGKKGYYHGGAAGLRRSVITIRRAEFTKEGGIEPSVPQGMDYSNLFGFIHWQRAYGGKEAINVCIHQEERLDP